MIVTYEDCPDRWTVTAARLIRRGILLWMMAVCVEYLHLSPELRNLSGLVGIGLMSPVRMVAVAALAGSVLFFLRRILQEEGERLLLAAVYTALAVITLLSSFTWPFFAACLLVQVMVLIYALRGWQSGGRNAAIRCREKKGTAWAVAAVTAAFFMLVSAWTGSWPRQSPCFLLLWPRNISG